MIGLDRSGGKLKETALFEKLASLGFEVDPLEKAVDLEKTPELKNEMLSILGTTSVVRLEDVQALEKLLGGRRSRAPVGVTTATADATVTGYVGRLTAAKRRLESFQDEPTRAQIQRMVHLFEKLVADFHEQGLSDPKLLGAATPERIDGLAMAYSNLLKTIGAFGRKHNAIMRVAPKLGKKLVDSFAKAVAEAPLFTSVPGSVDPKREVSSGFLRNLMVMGLERPLTSLDDPRLENPDVLLSEGWEKEKIGDTTSYQFKDPSGETQQRYGIDSAGRYIQSFHRVGAGRAEDEILREDSEGEVWRRTSDLDPVAVDVDSLVGPPKWEVRDTPAYRAYYSARLGNTPIFLGLGVREDGSVKIRVTGNDKSLDAEVVAKDKGRDIEKCGPSYYVRGHEREAEIISMAIREQVASMLKNLPADVGALLPALNANYVARRLT